MVSKYTFSVFNYTDGNKQELKNSGVMVNVYFSDQVNPFIFYVPNIDGNAWDVFEYNVTMDTFKVLNKVYTTSCSAVVPIVIIKIVAGLQILVKPIKIKKKLNLIV